MNIALWVGQIFLALAFLFSGGFKLLAYDTYAAMTVKQGSTPVSRSLAGFIGAVEIVGAIGVVLPLAINVVPALGAWSAVGLATVMLLAIGYHLRGHESAPAPLTLLLVAVLVAAGRFA